MLVVPLAAVLSLVFRVHALSVVLALYYSYRALVPLWRWAMLDVVAVYAVVGVAVRAGFRALFGGGRRRRRAAASSASAAAAAAANRASLHSDDDSVPLKPPITPNASPARERRPDTAFAGGQKPAAFGTSPPPAEGLRARGAAES